MLSSFRRVVRHGAFAVLAGVLSLAGLSLPAGAATTVGTITGAASVSSTLSATISGGTGQYSYQWYDCSAPVTAGATVPGTCSAATGSGNSGTVPNATTSVSYLLAATDYGFYVTVAVTDTTPTTAVSASTTLVTEPAPAVAVSPSLALVSSATLAGTAQTLSGVAASFTGSNLNYSYQWWDCTTQQTRYTSSLPSGCSPISGATTNAYTYAVTDIGSFVMVSVTATNHTGSITLYSLSSTAAISGSAPSISGSAWPTQGSQTSYSVQVANVGTWLGDPHPATFNVTWYRCTSPSAAGTTLGASCSAIPGSTTTASSATTGYTYTFTSADVTKYLVVGVSANNGILNSYVAYSANSAVVTGVAPAVAVYPVISGTPATGNTLSVNTGTFTGLPVPASFSYAWFTCASNPTFSGSGGSTPGLPSALSPYGCTQMSSNTNTQLLSVTGGYIIAEVSTNNGVGAYYYFTAQVGPVSGPTPPTGGVSITQSSNGVFTSSSSLTGGVPTPSYSYHWYTCSSPLASSNATATPPTLTGCLSGYNTSTGTTYTVSAADVTHAAGGGLMLVVTAINNSLTTYAWSGTTTLANTAPTAGSVTITGTGYLSSTLTAVPSFSAIPAPSFSYQWYDCPSSPVSVPGSCAAINGATGATYTPTALAEAALNSGADYVYVGVTANNLVGSPSTVYSGSGVLLLTQAPSNVTYPSVPASATTSTPLAANPGTWYGAPYPTFTYQWYVCTSPISAGAGLPSCAAIPLATASTYTPSGSYVGDYFAVAVTGNNGVLIGLTSTAVTVHSASTSTPLVASIAITAIAISGTPAVGNSLSVTATVTATGTYTTSYQWYQCTSAVIQSTTMPYGCSAIVGANGASYVPTASQVGYYLTAQVTVSSGLGTATEFAAASAAVTTSVPGAPTSVIASSGVGQVVVSWTASPLGLAATSYTVTANTGATCTSSTTTCTVTGLLSGTYYSFSVTATNAYGTSPASAVSSQVMPSKTAPTAPSAVTGVAQSQAVAVSWTAANQNGALITSYTVTSYPGGFTCTSAGTSCTVIGLTNGTAYTFSVTATNSVGVGPSSFASAAVTPRAMVPNAPALANVVAANRALKVSWSGAGANGSPVTGYIATAILGATAHTCTTTALTCTITGLNPGATYQVSVVATSAAGSSLSSASLAARVAGAPGALRVIRKYTTAAAIVIVVSVPANNGAPILLYQYYLAGKGWVNAGTSRVIIIRGLRARTTYSVTVRAVNAAGFGPFPKIFAMRTL